MINLINLKKKHFIVYAHVYQLKASVLNLTYCKMRVCVVGAGIIGLSTAFQIKKLIPSVELTVIANSFHPNTTSDVAGGIWEPHLVTYPDEQVLK